MNDYLLALIALGAAVLGHSLASGLAIERLLRRNNSRAAFRLWAGLAIIPLLLVLQNAQALELALKTGLYDLHQALLGGAAGLLTAGLLHTLSRRNRRRPLRSPASPDADRAARDVSSADD